MRTLKQLLNDRKLMKEITLFFDIETLQYNEANGRKRPSEFKNMTYSVAISWMNGEEVEEEIFPSFKEPMDLIINQYRHQKKKPTINLNAHNTNKYDNHFFRKDLVYYYPQMKIENFWLATSNEAGNIDTYKIKDLSTIQKVKGIILEKRIKSSINLELTFYLEGIKFYTTDNWVKSHSSIKMLGEKMLKLGVVTEDELKTDFDYVKYNREEDMSELEARIYARSVFDQLSKEELVYIRNDVILLAKSVYYYSELFKGFDYSKMTFTSNILDSYNTNDLTSFQLLNRIGKGKDKIEIRYTDYKFASMNFYDYLKVFYRGGLNFYNYVYISQTITTGVFGMDINSSYPFAMHKFKIPTYVKDYEEHETPTNVPISYSDDEFTLFQLSKETFDYYILEKIESVVLKQILVKYYTTNDFININTYTFKMIENITGLHFDSIPAFSRVTFETRLFGSRQQLEDFYFVKTQGKQEKKVIFNSPYDITLTDEVNTEIYSSEEIDSSKVNLNGVYGIPALRPYFNLFRKKEDGYVNIENGHKNAERNIVFSIFVTAVSLWNLLDPLKYLTQREIDQNLLYIDTDSLYMKKEIQHKLSADLFHPFHLGKWDLEHDNIVNFNVLNHKKYAFEEWNHKKQKMEITVRSGGISHASFNLDMSFQEFVKTQFSHGCKITNNKSIYNNDGTISIYPSVTELESGKGYRIRTDSKLYDQMKKNMLTQIRESLDEFTSDVLYVESVLGTFSLSDIFPVTHEVETKDDLVFLEIKQEKIRRKIEAG